MGRFDAATADQIFTASNAAPTRQSHRTDLRSPIAPAIVRSIAPTSVSPLAPTNDS